MVVSLCNCNQHLLFLPPNTFLNPSSPLHNCQYPNLPFKSIRRRTCISAAGADIQSVPKSAIQRIAEKLRSLGYVEESVIGETRVETSISSPNSPGEIFVPLRSHLPKHRVGHTLDTSWSTPENPVPKPGSGNAMQRFHEVRRVFLAEREEEKIKKRREASAPSLAELTLPEEELRRLRSLGIELRKKLKVGKAGITEGIVNGIHERWRRSEVVKITCEDICRLNMKRTHDMLERKTGGLVVWRSGSNIILYRGPNYKYPYFVADHESSNDSSSREPPALDMEQRISSEKGINSSVINSHPTIMQGVGVPNRVRFQLPGEAQLAEEADALLEGLGPRFNDWWGYNPLPVDADLLPAVVTGYKRPFRLLPYGVKPKLTNDEMTTLRRLGRPLPCHFVLGRNRKLQGLAVAMVKLWEKCEIAKIAVKRGVQNMNSELMAEELKWLTGGSLLSRDREFIVFYRGKDFLPAAVSSAIEERRKYELDVAKTTNLKANEQENERKEYANEVEDRKLKLAEAKMKRTNTKLSMALEKKDRAEKLLAELEKVEICQPPEMDKEGITEEERYMLRKVGLRMNPFLLLGRRGVFDGTVENMHLHWKYRELVKVCVGKRSIEEIHGIARTLEAESGGILVAVEPVNKGYAIIVYRGKNYKRPASLRPQTLLSKREAMKRSIEAQRRQSLKLHVLKLGKNIDELKLKLTKNEHTNDTPLRKDSKHEFGINENDYEEIVFCEDPQSDIETYLEDLVNEENVESFEPDATSTSPVVPDATSTSPVVFMNTSKDSTNIIGRDIPGDVSTPSETKSKYLFEITEHELQPRSIVEESKDSLNLNEQIVINEPPYNLRSRDGTSSSAFTCNLPNSRVDSDVGHQKGKYDLSVQKSVAEKPAVMPSRKSQLSNKERLLLRKRALKMKNRPVLAIGKNNVVTGVAKAIKTHFQKHSLAVVSIKGRAKGTSIQEVIYNLEQATGSVLVSQEPSKVILYRGWEAEAEPNQARNNSVSNVIARPVISPELISAIRLECGLKAVN